MRILLKPILLLPLLCISLLAKAEPMIISFPEMIEQSKTIVIAEFIESMHQSEETMTFGPYRIKVMETLRGDAEGEIIVDRAHGMVGLQPGTKCIAFINDRNEFEWAGTLHRGDDLTSGIISIAGFYDWNAYIVYPATITLPQLRQYLQTKSYTGTISGNLHFLSAEERAMKPSDISIAITYTYRPDSTTHHVTTTGMEFADFPDQPGIAFGGWDNNILLEYEGNMVRPLKFNGELTSVSDNGLDFEALFYLEAPEELTKEEFIRYITNPQLGPPYWETELVTEDGERYLFVLGIEYGRIGYLVDFRGTNWDCNRLGTPHPNYDKDIQFGGRSSLIIDLEDREDDPVNKKLCEYTTEDYVRMSMLSPYYGQLILDGENLGRCHVEYKRTLFSKNPNYRKE